MRAFIFLLFFIPSVFAKNISCNGQGVVVDITEIANIRMSILTDNGYYNPLILLRKTNFCDLDATCYKGHDEYYFYFLSFVRKNLFLILKLREGGVEIAHTLTCDKERQ